MCPKTGPLCGQPGDSVDPSADVQGQLWGGHRASPRVLRALGCCLLSFQLWGGCLLALSLGFLTCKIGLMVSALQGTGWGQ